MVLAADGLPLDFALQGAIGLESGEPVLLPLSGEDRTRVRSVGGRAVALSFTGRVSDGKVDEGAQCRSCVVPK